MTAFEEIRLGHAESDPPRRLRTAAPYWPAAALVAICLVAGGASQGNSWPLAITEACGLLVLLGQVWRWSQVGAPTRARWPIVVLCTIALIPIVQLVPLPPGLWAALPGHGTLANDLAIAGAGDRWRPLSLAPDLTWRSLLALIPPAAVLLATIDMDARGQARVAAVAVVVAVASVLLASAQLAGGPFSALRFYAITNADSGVGFFSNRNHLACLLAAAMPLTAALLSDLGQERRSWSWMAGFLGVYLLLIVGVGASLSRAGMILLAPAMLASLVIALTPRELRRPPVARPAGPAIAVVGASVVGLLLVAAFSLATVAQRFHQESATDIRFQAAPAILAAAGQYAPFGAGVGAFEPVYRAAEPANLISPTYLNHAHDDFLEIWLEAGVAGAIGVAAFLVWWLRASMRVWPASWRAAAPSALAPGASAAIGLMLIHSLVDYPLRTVALACLFAFACGVLYAQARPAED